jgi:hypothetical protein|tara:strand:- start:3190 stop:3912 length:723 start_codon:yes stop_codon:yes gene_type:complete
MAYNVSIEFIFLGSSQTMVNDDNNKTDSIVPESDDRIGRGGVYINRPVSRDLSSSNQENLTPEDGISWHKISNPFLIITVVGLIYLVFVQDAELSKLQERFDVLETNVITTDINSNLKEQDLKLDKHWSEIKKLWGIAYDRNSKSIKKIKTTLEYQKQDLASISKKMEKSNKSMNSLVNSSLATKLEVNDLVAKYGSKPSKDVEIRILENEKAIEAIDAHRLVINRDIQQLKSQLNIKPD